MAPAPDKSWYNAPRLFEIAASQQGGPRGAQLWGNDQDNMLRTTYQETPGGGWSGWIGPNWADAPGSFIRMAAAQQNNGCVQFWGIDTDPRGQNDLANLAGR